MWNVSVGRIKSFQLCSFANSFSPGLSIPLFFHYPPTPRRPLMASCSSHLSSRLLVSVMSVDERHSFIPDCSLVFPGPSPPLRLLQWCLTFPCPLSLQVVRSVLSMVFIPLDHYETLTWLMPLRIWIFQCLWRCKCSSFFDVLFVPRAFLQDSLPFPSVAPTTTYILMTPRWLPSAPTPLSSSRPRFPDFLVSSGASPIRALKYGHLQMKQIKSPKTICFYSSFLLLVNVISISCAS